jgi:OHCU decarboxylase
MSLPSIEDFNNSDFSSLSLLFEHSPLLQTLLTAQKPFNSFEDIISKAHQILLGLDRLNQIEILNAHPRIGAPLETISDQSRNEQGRQELYLEKTLNDLKMLNEKYELKFGFRFVVFVNGRKRSEIVEVVESRLGNSIEKEITTAIDDMVLIARSRLSKLQTLG